MKTLLHRHHLKVMSNHFEASLIVGFVVTLADMVWCVHDILVNGFNPMYGVIFTGLLIGVIGLGMLIVSYHKKSLEEYRHQLMLNKIARARYRFRHKLFGGKPNE